MSQDDLGGKRPSTGHGRGPDSADQMLGHVQLLRRGEQAAQVLTGHGVGQDDAVAVLLPMSLESVVVTLACIRVGAMRVTLPVGDHVGFVRGRIRSSGARVVITADSCRVDDRVHHVKNGLDRALWGCPEVRTVLVVSQLSGPVSWVPDRDVWWHEELAAAASLLDGGGAGGDPYAGDMSRTPPPDRPMPALASLDFGDPLNQRAPDDADEGWGERPEEDSSAAGGLGDLARFLRDRPPHHL